MSIKAEVKRGFSISWEHNGGERKSSIVGISIG